MEGYKVCVYAIAKDEAKFAARWAESMSEADAVYVLDTGSSDDTVKILNWIAKMLEEEKEKLSQEKQRLSENYDREKQVYEEKILQLQESSAIITALQNEVKVC